MSRDKSPTAFDPTLIIYQIVCLQSFFYLSMTVCLSLVHAVLDMKISLDHFFNPAYVNFTTNVGWITIAAAAVSSFAGAHLLSIVVEKSKKCVDFTFTCYLVHLLSCCLYMQRFPLGAQFWVVNVVCSVVMASGGEYICSRNELQDIPLYSLQ